MGTHSPTTHSPTPLILASASPRRKLLLKQFKIPFKIVHSRLFEPPPGILDPISYTRKLALAKAQGVAQKVGEGWVLGADTVVVHQGQILGKPVDFADACRMLSRLQGTTHKVVTAIALVNAATSKSKVAHSVSWVTMRRLELREIAQVATKNMDKAGGYAVQEKKDPVIEKIKGSYTNVVGLPVEVLKKLLKSLPKF